MQFAFTLVAALGQLLLPTADGKGRVLATEVLINTPAVGNLIREQKNQQIRTVIETQGRLGMHTMDSTIKDMYRQGIITHETASSHIIDPTVLQSL
jgi:twitching motility protein PilT